MTSVKNALVLQYAYIFGLEVRPRALTLLSALLLLLLREPSWKQQE